MELRTTLMVIAAIGFLYVVLPVAIDVFFRFRGRRSVRCPRTGVNAEITIDAWHAAATAVPGPPRMHLTTCSRWPENADCGRECVDRPEIR